jgi:hypothetical protein
MYKCMCGHYTTCRLCCPLADSKLFVGFQQTPGNCLVRTSLRRGSNMDSIFQSGRHDLSNLEDIVVSSRRSPLVLPSCSRLCDCASWLQLFSSLAWHLKDFSSSGDGGQLKLHVWDTGGQDSLQLKLEDFLDWNSLIYFFHLTESNVGIHRFYYCIWVCWWNAAAPLETGTLSSYDTLVLPRCGGCCALAANLRTSLKIFEENVESPKVNQWRIIHENPW